MQDLRILLSYLRQHLDIFFYLLLLSSFFLLLEISYFIAINNQYFTQLNLTNNNFHLPSAIFYSIFFFIFIQFLIHFLFTMMIWLITLSLANNLRLKESHIFNFSIAIWVGTLLTILFANAYYFPNSSFTDLLKIILPIPQFFPYVFKLFFLFFSILYSIAILFFLKKIIICVFKNLNTTSFNRVWIISIALIIGSTYIILKSFFTLLSIANKQQIQPLNEKPNIIIVGVDSLRPDFLGYFGHETPAKFIDSFLEKATVFSEAVTPLARTFPSWTSILTGAYPKQHGARTNLVQQKNINLSSSLPHILQQYGYETIYASDEARFSNIDENFGFSKIITPPMGINDFIIGTLNDFPFSNFFLDTKLGHVLFPYNYANRPTYVNYDPDSFLERLHSIFNKPNVKPLFLAVHFCLPHHPYSWKDLAETTLSMPQRYQASILRVDQQLSDFFALMKKNHILDNAMVVFLSDHGEALDMPGDRLTEKELYLKTDSSALLPLFYPGKLSQEALNRSTGHGTDVLSLSQYHTLLAFKVYGNVIKQNTKIIHGPVSLLSIKPTILDYLGISKKDNKSLLNFMSNEHLQSVPLTHIFLESDFSPNAILSIHPDIQQVILEGIKIFQINPHSLRLSVKKDMYQMIIKSKQYADIYGDWMLALYPQTNQFKIAILINLKTGQWTNDLHSSFARHSPVINMLENLKNFYGDEINMKKINL